MKSMIHVGPDSEETKETISSFAKHIAPFILRILNSPAGDDVKKKALDILTSPAAPQNITISNCSLVNGTSEKPGFSFVTERKPNDRPIP